VRYLISLVAGLALLSISTAGYAEEPAGIVMAMTGDSTPPLSVMAEIPAGLALELKPETKLTFLHYGRCKLVTVVGGTLVLQAADYKSGGTVAGETDAPCPQTFELSNAGSAGRTTGGIVARGISLPPRWPANPQFVFTGPRAAAVTGATILTENRQPVLRLDVGSGWGKPGAGAAPLQPNAHYALLLTLRDQAQPIDMPFTAGEPASAGTPIVLRFD
jgi:hypothetical protein